MKVMLKGLSGLILLTVVTSLPAEETVKAPSGWDDDYVGTTRVVTNGNATVHIMPWQDLEGRSVDQWLTELESLDPLNGELVTSGAVKPESVNGAYSVNRKTRVGNSEGYSILYGCLGQTGHARLMMFEVSEGGLFEMLKGGKFVEKVCELEPRGSGSDAGTADIALGKQASERKQASAAQVLDVPVSQSTISDAQLKKLNQALPKVNRPINATVVLKTTRSGFPPVRNRTAHMVLEFPDGTELACSGWSPAGEFPSNERRQSNSCQFPEIEDRAQVRGFEPGERIALAFKTISVSYTPGVDGNTSTLRGGNLVMGKDGSISVGSWFGGQIAASALTARVIGTRKGGLIGRYYLDGYTISIATSDGEVIHGLIGYSNRNETKEINAVFLNGKHFWDRSK